MRPHGQAYPTVVNELRGLEAAHLARLAAKEGVANIGREERPRGIGASLGGDDGGRTIVLYIQRLVVVYSKQKERQTNHSDSRPRRH